MNAAVTSQITAMSLIKAEWIKFRTVKSSVISLVAAGGAMIMMGTLFSSLPSGESALPPGATAGTDSISMSFGGMNIAQLVLGVMGALFVTSEYGSGLIRTMFATVGSRAAVLRSKAVVLGLSTWVVMTIASMIVFFTGQLVYAGDGATYSIGDPGVLRAVLGGGVYATGIVLMGMALGFTLKSTAAAVGTLVASLMILPGLVGFLPSSVSESVGKFLPSTSGQAFMAVEQSKTLLSPSAGFAVFVGWVLLSMIAAIVVLRRGDA